jgi:hypothetical protein
MLKPESGNLKEKKARSLQKDRIFQSEGTSLSDRGIFSTLSGRCLFSNPSTPNFAAIPRGLFFPMGMIPASSGLPGCSMTAVWVSAS